MTDVFNTLYEAGPIIISIVIPVAVVGLIVLIRKFLFGR